MKKITLIVLALIMVFVMAGCVKSDAETVAVDGETFTTIYGATGERCKANSTERRASDGENVLVLEYSEVTEEVTEEYCDYLSNNGYALIYQQEMTSYDDVIPEHLIAYVFDYEDDSKQIIVYDHDGDRLKVVYKVF